MKKFTLFVCSLVMAFTLSAQPGGRQMQPSSIVLPDILKGSVVLQQGTNARIWGKATPGVPVKVNTSWNDATYNTTAAADSLWEVKVATPVASYTSYVVTITSGKDQVVMNDVLIGDVWVCGGQSNMAMPMKGMYGCYVEGATDDIATSSQYKGLRMVTVAQNKAKESDPTYFTKGTWTKSTPKAVADFSATGFHFGATLSKALDYPIGLISCNWSGSFVEDWFSKELLEQYPDQKVFGAEFTKAFTQMYYGMLEPTSKFTIKGMIWYQGESNVGSPDYDQRLAAAVELWKSKFELETMPFYIVELAPYAYNQGYEGRSPFTRELQLKASKLIPDGGFVSTSDLVFDYEPNMIHPAQKKAVGQRLAYVALNKAYKMGNPCEGPEFDSYDVEEGSIFVSFNNLENGFMVKGPFTNFEIAGEDGVFYPANAVSAYARPKEGEARRGFGKQGVRVSSEKVKNPVAVRYCWKDFVIGDIHNTEGLPMVPFRTDNWEK